jgi:hypothetical protein
MVVGVGAGWSVTKKSALLQGGDGVAATLWCTIGVDFFVTRFGHTFGESVVIGLVLFLLTSVRVTTVFLEMVGVVVLVTVVRGGGGVAATSCFSVCGGHTF